MVRAYIPFCAKSRGSSGEDLRITDLGASTGTAAERRLSSPAEQGEKPLPWNVNKLSLKREEEG